MKKRKILKGVGMVLLLATLWLGWSIYKAVYGPPWENYVAKRGAMKYLEERYPEERFQIVDLEKRRPLFAPSTLTIFVSSEEKPEEVFELDMSFQGEVEQDRRRFRQQERYFNELQERYQVLVREALGADFVTEESSFRADLSPYTSMGNPGSFNIEDLDPDGEVDLRAMSTVRGNVELRLVSEDRSVEAFIRLFSEIRSRLERAGLSASAIRLELVSKDAKESGLRVYLPQRVKSEELEAYIREEIGGKR